MITSISKIITRT